MNQKTVIVYSTPTCKFCKTVKDYLRSKNIRFYDVDITKDERAAREMVRKTGQQGVPVVDIGGKMVLGFDKVKIDKMLGIT